MGGSHGGCRGVATETAKCIVVFFYLVFRTKVTLVIEFSGKKTPTEPSP